jgi:hypothetical protein
MASSFGPVRCHGGSLDWYAWCPVFLTGRCTPLVYACGQDADGLWQVTVDCRGGGELDPVMLGVPGAGAAAAVDIAARLTAAIGQVLLHRAFRRCPKCGRPALEQ